MVAFLRPETPSRTARSLPGDPGPRPEARPHLRLVVDNTGSAPSGLSAPANRAGDESVARADLTAPSTRPAPAGPFIVFDRLVERLSASPVLGPVIGSGPAVALAAALIVGALLAVRVAQGQPPALDWSGTVSAASSSSAADKATAGSDDLVVVAAPGDSLWSIAERYAPGHDRRDAVATLADLNGGSTVQVGQQVVVPRELLD